MTWRYQQSTGDLWHFGSYEGRGYSGHGAGLNNHALEADAGVGPVPVGMWKIGPAHRSLHTGPITMNLDPVAPNTAHGRSLFRIHGDNSAANHSASRGCIILGRALRQVISTSSDYDLEVFP